MTDNPQMPLLIEDAEVRDLVANLAERLETTEQLAIKTAVEAELKRHDVEPTPRKDSDAPLGRFLKRTPKSPSDDDPRSRSTESKDGRSLKERLEEFYRRHPKPEPTGLPADKAFYDEMSGEFD